MNLRDTLESEAELNNVDVYVWCDKDGEPILREWYAPDTTRTVKTAPVDDDAIKRFYYGDVTRTIDTDQTQVFWKPRTSGDAAFGVFSE